MKSFYSFNIYLLKHHYTSVRTIQKDQIPYQIMTTFSVFLTADSSKMDSAEDELENVSFQFD